MTSVVGVPPFWCLGLRCSARINVSIGGRVSLRSLARRALCQLVSTPRSSAWRSPHLRGDPVQHHDSADGFRSCLRYRRRSSSVSCCRPAGAGVQGGHGTQPLQHGLYGGPVGTPVVAMYSGYGFVPDPRVHLDHRQQRALGAFLARLRGHRSRRDSSSTGARWTVRSSGHGPIADRLHRQRPDSAPRSSTWGCAVHRHGLRVPLSRCPLQRSRDRRHLHHRGLRGVRQAPAQPRADHGGRVRGHALEDDGSARSSLLLAALFGTTPGPSAASAGTGASSPACCTPPAAAQPLQQWIRGRHRRATILVPIILAVRKGRRQDDQDCDGRLNPRVARTARRGIPFARLQFAILINPTAPRFWRVVAIPWATRLRFMIDNRAPQDEIDADRGGRARWGVGMSWSRQGAGVHARSALSIQR